MRKQTSEERNEDQSCIPALLVWSLSASAATIRIDPSTTSTSIGSTIDVNVQIADGADLYAYQFDLTFNPAILSASTMSEASFLAGGGSTFFIPGAIDNVLGSITLTANTWSRTRRERKRTSRNHPVHSLNRWHEHHYAVECCASEL